MSECERWHTNLMFYIPRICFGTLLRSSDLPLKLRSGEALSGSLN